MGWRVAAKITMKVKRITKAMARANIEANAHRPRRDAPKTPSSASSSSSDESEERRKDPYDGEVGSLRELKAKYSDI